MTGPQTVEREFSSVAGLEWWKDVLTPENRLRGIAEGVLVDVRCAPAQGQELEHVLRDSVAAPYVRSPQAAIREAARHHSRGVMLRRAEAAVAHARQTFPQGALIVDLGCGFGWHWVELARRFPHDRFILLDFSLVNLRVCRNLMPAAEYPHVMCVQASILDLPVRDAVASLAWSVQVLQHLPQSERAKALKEMRRILTPGAAFYVAWIRNVPMVRGVRRLLARSYHTSGMTAQGMFLERFNEQVLAELRGVFSHGAVSLSESLFHPDLRFRGSQWLTSIDLALSATPVGRLLARQAEFTGTA